ncbi:lipopolysaccharide export system permease protein [Pelagimonas varians]|uniref:Putative permease YjgP/YjgQ family protein n=2 Tax=Pelagimonas varians TaxID=696760 RepID=A0A238JS77_9RHOB|nr:lipopolysaccharide export system permease protein [Pelagimonas varians]SMX33511.1 putative permease YjgP/YjgQ family protein [Pelagimonas varians]
MVLFGFFALVLVSVYWVNKAVVLFDSLIADGHSAGVFMEFTALSLPSVVALVLPMSAFAATVYVTNRMSGDSELTVVQSTGYSPWRLARPVFAFGLVVGLMMSILTHVLVPKSIEQLRLREQEIAGSVTASLLREGTFLHPSKGITFYIRDIAPDGELHDVFLSDRRTKGREVTYTAERAFLVRDDAGPKLVMLAGMAQTLDLIENKLSTTNFNDLTHDISGLISKPGVKRRRVNQIPTAELLFQTAAIAEETKKTEGEVLEEAHTRFQAPLLCLIASLVGFSALISGGFSRFGVTKQIIGAIFLLVVIKLVESLITEPARSDPRLWPLVYLPSLVGLAMVLTMLWRAAGTYRPRRRPKQEAPA